MATHETDFPYYAIPDRNGDYWPTIDSCLAAGFKLSQVWSVTVTDTDEDNDDPVWCYGPAHHYVNLIGYVVTFEHHDGDTYYVDACGIDN